MASSHSIPQIAARRIIGLLARYVAFAGGMCMVAAMLVTVSSVVGGFFGSPILGEAEIVSSCIVLSVFAFLPYCHLLGQNIMVDLFSKPLPQFVRNALDVLMSMAFAAITVIITWRLFVGGMQARDRESMTMFLQIPEWPIYLLCSIASLLWVVVALLVTWEATLRACGKLPPLDASEPQDYA